MRYLGKNITSGGVPDMYDKTKNVGGVKTRTGLFLGKVVDIVDDRYEGYMYVQIFGEEYLGKQDSLEEKHKYTRVRRSSPYGGSYQSDDHTRSYGMSSHPPAPGTEVVVAFVHNSDVGICLGALPTTGMNGSVPTAPASFVEGEENVVGPTFDSSPTKDAGKNTKPRNQELEYVTKQGLGFDSIRGLSSSSQRRESPTNVFGFNTPGGHQLTMDDGTRTSDDNCLSPDKNRKPGLSRLARFRSAGGAQILMHDGAGIVYITNQDGSNWIQFGADGKIDIYSQSDISMHTETNFNLHVGGNFNLDADAINMKARGTDGITLESATGEFNLHANKDIKFTTDLNHHLVAKGTSRSTAPLIDFNGPPATAATKTVQNNRTENTTVKQSITDRVPEAQPWGGHTEEQEILPQVASANGEQTATDIDLSDIKNTSTQPSTTVSAGKTAVSSTGPQGNPTTNPRTGPR